jgi:hypothetical protein
VQKWLDFAKFRHQISRNFIDTTMLKRQSHEIFDLCFFINQLPLGPWLTLYNIFEFETELENILGC